jgi:hypothetical protein
MNVSLVPMNLFTDANNVFSSAFLPAWLLYQVRYNLEGFGTTD